MYRQKQLRWSTRRQFLWAFGIVAVLMVSVIIGYRYGITLWEWIKLLFVPAVIAGGGIWFNRQQRNREMEIAEQRAQDEALQAYLDQISQLLTDEKRPLHRASPDDSLSTVARARTLSVLSRLDGERKRSVVEFLHEARLILRDRPVLYLRGANLGAVNFGGASLSDIDLSDVYLHEASLIGAYLRGASLILTDLRGASLIHTNLREADLLGAKLSGTNMHGADLRKARLTQAELEKTDLRHAHLAGADLIGTKMCGADLRGAYLSRSDPSEQLRLLGENQAPLSATMLLGADLREAKLDEIDLSDANLTNANLTGATGWTEEQFAAAKALIGATMPDGQKLNSKSFGKPNGPTFEEWRKDKEGRKEHRENSSPS